MPPYTVTLTLYPGFVQFFPGMSNNIELDKGKYAVIIKKMIENATDVTEVTDRNVFQEARPANKPLLQEIIRDLMLPGSRVDGLEHLVELHQIALRKKACLILMEHYSNFDLPCLLDLLEESGAAGREAADSIVAVAGVKLSEESKLVLAFTEIFTRVVLFPARSVSSAKDPAERLAAEGRRARINVAALKALNSLRTQGRIILVFPTGTRYRPWDPSTGKGLKEIDTYLKFYSHMVHIAINGNTLLPNPKGRMDEDYPRKDLMLYTVSPVIKCSDFRREAVKGRGEDEDLKQHVVDRVMAALGVLHEEAEKKRLQLLAASGQT
jgi:hypothetical protein